jgi:putative FmdB family regulatory protein
MPIYEYECRSCNRVFEFWQKLSDQPKTDCPHCSGPITKLMSLSSFRLKGGGWYADGYSSESKAKEATGAAASEKKSPEKSSEAKPKKADT